MNNNSIHFARPEQSSELIGVWGQCFEEPAASVEYFFNHRFQPENCLVYEVDGRAAAMVHMLPAHIIQAGSLAQAHYIYAAATLPQYRSRGYMSELLQRAAEVGVERGDRYSFLLPSNNGLYTYYAKLGYISYFQTRLLTLSYAELQSLASGGQKSSVAVLTHRQIESRRNTELLSQQGSVVWSEHAIGYSVGVNELNGGRIVGSRSQSGLAYALCSLNDEHCEVLELMADQAAQADVLANILHYVPAQTYRFRLPGFSGLFPGQGEMASFGMLKPLTGAGIPQNARPYLGLTLD